MMMTTTTTMIMLIIMTTTMMLFWDLHTADDDDGGGGDNDDYYDDDDHAFLGLFVAPDRPSTAKTLTDDCSALYWTQELGLTCLESGRRAASNEPSCFSRR